MSTRKETSYERRLAASVMHNRIDFSTTRRRFDGCPSIYHILTYSRKGQTQPCRKSTDKEQLGVYLEKIEREPQSNDIKP